MSDSQVRLGVRWMAVFVLVASAGCSGSSPTVPAPGGGGGGGGGTFTLATNVEVGDNFFSPQNIQVSPSARVTWTWLSTAATHNVTFESVTGINIPNQPGGAHSTTMPAARNDYSYRCTIHSGMTGTVRVQ